MCLLLCVYRKWWERRAGRAYIVKIIIIYTTAAAKNEVEAIVNEWLVIKLPNERAELIEN
jgi:hypothetical protein